MSIAKQFPILLFTIFVINNLSSQSSSRFYTNFNNDFASNPALASKKDYTQVGLNYIREWAGFEGSPMMVNFYGTMIEADRERWATSLILDYESFGATNYFNVSPGYSFNVLNYERTFSLASAVRFSGVSFDGLKVPIDVQTETQMEFGVIIGGYFASVAPAEEYEATHYYAGLSTQLTAFSFSENTDRKFLNSANMLVGYKLFLNEELHVEPRLSLGYNFSENSIYSSSLNVEVENYDYAYGDRFGWYGNIGFIYNSPKGVNIGSQFNSSITLGSYLTIGGGLMLNPGQDNNVIKAGSFFEYGLNQLSNTNAINFGIQINYFLFDFGW